MYVNAGISVPTCRYGHGEMELIQGPHTSMFALANINMFGMVEAGSGMAVRVFRCPTCFTLELRDISQEEFDQSVSQTRDMYGPHG